MKKLITSIFLAGSLLFSSICPIYAQDSSSTIVSINAEQPVWKVIVYCGDLYGWFILKDTVGGPQNGFCIPKGLLTFYVNHGPNKVHFSLTAKP